jgi:hypothetical protein
MSSRTDWHMREQQKGMMQVVQFHLSCWQALVLLTGCYDVACLAIMDP